MSRFLAAALILLLGVAAGDAAILALAARARPSEPPLQQAIDRSAFLGEVDPGRPMTVTLTLRQRNAAGLKQLLGSGHTISAAEFDARFAPDPTVVEAAENRLRAAGVSPAWSAGSTLLTVDGSAGALEQLLGVRFRDYRGADGRRFYAADREAVLPAYLRGLVAGVGGLDSWAHLSGHAVRPGGMTPDDVLAFYNIKALRDQGFDGSGETVVMPEIDDLPNANDLSAYATRFHLPPFDVTVKRDPNWGKPMDAGQVGAEVTLDLEVVHAIAPKAKLIAYIGSPRQDLSSRLFDQLVRDNPAAIISDSLGACELEVPASIRQAAAQQNDRAVAQGMSHFVASGDAGAFDCGPDKPPGVDFPSALPSVTSVGGTTVFESKEGVYFRETVWGNAVSQAGAGGGLSHYYDRPDYQTGPGVQNKDSNGKRQVPDVAGVADANTGWSLIVGGNKAQVGGTSAAAPLWAGVTALINQALRKKSMRRVGFASPAVYWMGQNRSKFQTAPFHDVTQGNNLLYGGSTGWDYGTGWGTMDAVGLEAAFESYIKQGGR